MFGDDYDTGNGVGSYPDAEHIINTKMVLYSDTTSPNYNNPDYQKVGIFTKGLFKGCYTTCNYEVIDRCLKVATAFCNYYFGLDHFADAHRHGVYYIDCQWKDNDGFYYRNREKTIIDGAYGRYYRTRMPGYSTLKDIFLEQGIKLVVQDGFRTHSMRYGQIGLFYGQNELRAKDQNMTMADGGGYVGYPQLFGVSPTEGIEGGTYADFMNFMRDVPDWLAFIYKENGNTVTRNGLTRTIYPAIPSVIDSIRSCVGTGLVPKINYDSLSNNPAVIAGVEMTLRFIQDMGFEAVPFSKAQELVLSKKRESGGNLFPNPSFVSSLALITNGNTEKKDEYLPDGWVNTNGVGSLDFIRTKEIIAGAQRFVFSIGGSVLGVLHTRMYGLKAGKYKLSFYLKCSEGATNTRAMIYLIKNSSVLNLGDITPDVTINATESWTLCEQEIVIPEPTHSAVDTTSAISMLCDGYQDNVINVTLRLRCVAGHRIYFADPKMVLEQ